MSMTKKFARKRIVEQYDYINEIAFSDRSIERKKELIESATGVIANIMLQFKDDLDMAFFLAFTVVGKMKEAAIRYRPKMLYGVAKGGVAIVGEEGRELIITPGGTKIIPHDDAIKILREQSKN